jgi:hypothetical protein
VVHSHTLPRALQRAFPRAQVNSRTHVPRLSLAHPLQHAFTVAPNSSGTPRRRPQVRSREHKSTAELMYPGSSPAWVL